MGSSAQFGNLSPVETRRADRTLQAALFAWRATGLATGVASLLGGGARYRSRSLAVVQLAVAAAESVWLARRVDRLDRWCDPVGSAVDAATAVCLLALGHRNLAGSDRVTWINWVPWSFAANAISGQAMAGNAAAQRVGGAAAVIAAHAVQGPAAGDALANAGAQTGFAVGGGFFAAQIRSGAVRLAQARAAAVEQGRMLAVARERAVQLRLLHDNAVQTLEAISGGRYTDLASIRLRARAEAERLEAALDRVAAAAALVEWLALVAAEHRARGLVVELDVDRAAAVVPSVAEAIAAACSEALTNVAKHAETREVTVRVRVEGTGVILVVDDRGVGFVAESRGGGFGMTQSIYGRMADVGGSASVTSRPGVGTRVELRWPA